MNAIWLMKLLSAHHNIPLTKGLLLAFFIPFLFGGCKALKSDKERVEFENLKKLKTKVERLQPNYEWFNAEIKVSIQTPERNLQGKGHLKIRKDSLIWLTISPALGIEVLRARITPDSIFLLNRVEKRFRTFPFKKVNQFTNTGRDRNLEFNNITNLLTGQPLFPIRKDHRLKKDSASITLNDQNQAFDETIALLPKILKTQKYRLAKPATNQSISISYKNYQQVDSCQIPGQINLIARKPQRFHLEISLKNVYFSQEEQVSFSVPSHYEKVR